MALVTNVPTFSLEYFTAVRTVQYQLVAASSFLLWDSILTVEEEIEYVWGMRCSIFKWFYFYFRYFLLAAQIFHLTISPRLWSGRMPDSLCLLWYRYTITVLQVSVCMIEIIMATRVFALFNRSRVVGVFLGILILFHLAGAVSSTVQCREVEYFEACILPQPRKEMITPQATLIIAIQSITIGMTIFKHVVGIRLGWGRTPLLSFLVRDATGNYVGIFLLCGISLAASGVDDLRIVAIAPWAISLLSTIGCRLIINMEQFARRTLSNDDILLTTHISL